jgi:PTS system galactitol-specific IIA component
VNAAPELTSKGKTLIMSNVIFSEDLIELQINASEKEPVIKILCDKLLANDFVKDSFYANVLKREEVFPTGLPTSIPMAICHTESEHVNQSAIAVGTLNTPVAFQEMGTPENDVMVEMVFVIALKDPKDQVPWLQKMMLVFRDDEILKTIRNADKKENLVEYLNGIFS